jgi:hypothetical protein
MADGTEPAPTTGGAPAGATFLTNGVPEAPPAPPANGATEAIQGALDAPPEWAPQKFWDPKTKTVRNEDMGRAYQNLEKLIGREKVPVPTGDDDEEGWNRWYAATGRPDTAEDYQFERPTLPSELPYDEATEKAFRTWAHVNGLNKRQAKNLYDGYVKTQLERHANWHTEQSQARSNAEQALRREHGQQYDAFITNARTAMTRYADPDFRQWLDSTGMGNDPRLIRAFGRIGKEMNGESRLKGAAPQQAASSQDLDRAIADFRGKHEKALFDRSHPDHNRRVAEYNSLFEQRYPS